MANRPVFLAQAEFPYVKIEKIDFKFYSGFALSQSQKSIRSLHDSFVLSHPEYKGIVLEVSSKAEISLGVHLSAFNLMYTMNDKRKRFVENVFQASKCFSKGGPYYEILDMSASKAKHFSLLRTSGEIIQFKLEGRTFPTEPKTFFYDWLYINALYQNQNLANQVMAYRAFTDIAFNPERSLNCQARSVALFVALKEIGILDEAISTPERFLEIAYASEEKIKKNNDSTFQQISMFN